MAKEYLESLMGLFRATLRQIAFYIMPLEYHQYEHEQALDGYWHFHNRVIAFQDGNGKLNFTW